MDENLRKRNETLAKTVIKGLKSRNMSGYYAADKEEALKLALELIPEGSTISMGGCASAQEVGLIKALKEGNYNYIDRAKLSPWQIPRPSSTTLFWPQTALERKSWSPASTIPTSLTSARPVFENSWLTSRLKSRTTRKCFISIRW